MSLSCFNLILLYCTPHSSNNFLEAMLFSEFAYLSDKYTISFRADTRGTNSYIELKSNIIKDNAENSNNTTKSNIFEVLPNTYTLTYNSNGCGNDCNPKTKTVTYGEKYGELCTLSRIHMRLHMGFWQNHGKTPRRILPSE